MVLYDRIEALTDEELEAELTIAVTEPTRRGERLDLLLLERTRRRIRPVPAASGFRALDGRRAARLVLARRGGAAARAAPARSSRSSGARNSSSTSLGERPEPSRACSRPRGEA